MNKIALFRVLCLVLLWSPVCIQAGLLSIFSKYIKININKMSVFRNYDSIIFFGSYQRDNSPNLIKILMHSQYPKDQKTILNIIRNSDIRNTEVNIELSLPKIDIDINDETVPWEIKEKFNNGDKKILAFVLKKPGQYDIAIPQGTNILIEASSDLHLAQKKTLSFNL